MKRLKCVALGDPKVGRTSLLHVLFTGKFPKGEVFPLNVYFCIDFNGKSVELGLFETEDDYRQDRLRPQLYEDTNLFLVCFSVTSPSSFENIKTRWLPEIQQHCPYTPFMLVGVKSDLRHDHDTLTELAQANQRPVAKEEAEQVTKELGAVKYVECSALKQEGITDLQNEALTAAMKNYSKNHAMKCIIV